jgi:hypothetical protein
MTNTIERILIWEEKEAIQRLRQSIQSTADVINKYNSKYPVDSYTDIPTNIDAQIMEEYLKGSKMAREMNSVKKLNINEVALPEELRARRAAVNEYNGVKKNPETLMFIVKKDAAFVIDEDKFNQAVDEKRYRRYLTTEEEITRFNFVTNYLESIKPFLRSDSDKPNYKIPAVLWGMRDTNSLYRDINFNWVRQEVSPM